MTTTEQIEQLGEKIGYLQSLNKKRKKALKDQFAQLTRQQLIALAVQKKVLPYRDALAKSADDLRNLLYGIEGILKPVQA